MVPFPGLLETKVPKFWREKPLGKIAMLEGFNGKFGTIWRKKNCSVQLSYRAIDNFHV